MLLKNRDKEEKYIIIKDDEIKITDDLREVEKENLTLNDFIKIKDKYIFDKREKKEVIEDRIILERALKRIFLKEKSYDTLILVLIIINIFLTLVVKL